MGLLLSVVPETFSYTLRELQEMRLPVLATNIGSFTDRIENGITGLLCAPEPRAVLDRLKDVAQDRTPLRRIYENLTNLAHRSVEEMLQDYETLYPRDYSARRYFENPEAPQPLPERNLQLFWRTAKNTFTEKDSVVVAPLGRERQIVRLHFVLPAEPIEQFRLDLSSQPGFFFLHELLLRDFQENVLWSWDHKISSLESPLQNDILFLQPDNRDESALLYFEGNDPFLLLPIPPSLLAQMKRGGSVEVTFSLASAEASTDVLISSVRDVQKKRDAQEKNIRPEQLEFKAEIIERDARIHELEKQLVAVQNSTSWHLTRPARALAAGMRKMKRLMIHSTGHVSSEQVR